MNELSFTENSYHALSGVVNLFRKVSVPQVSL